MKTPAFQAVFQHPSPTGCASCALLATQLLPTQSVCCVDCHGELTAPSRSIPAELHAVRRWLPAILGRATLTEGSSSREPVDGRVDWVDEEHAGLRRALEAIRWLEQLCRVDAHTVWVLWGTYVYGHGARNSQWCRCLALLSLPRGEAFDLLAEDDGARSGPAALKLVTSGRGLIAAAIQRAEAQLHVDARSSGMWIPAMIDRCSRSLAALALLEEQAAQVRAARAEEERAERAKYKSRKDWRKAQHLERMARATAVPGAGAQ